MLITQIKMRKSIWLFKHFHKRSIPMNKIKTTLIIIAFVATAGIVSIAFAHGGWGENGYGGHMMGHGYNMGPGMMGYGPGYGRYDRGNYPADLSKEDGNKLQQARDKFLDETRTLRNQIRDKQFALNDELDKANPDKANVAKLQRAISKLQSDYDQKTLAYRLEVRKILPEGARDYGYGYGPGYDGCAW
jgi:Spy/CpxP family protein refolding chaperone